MLRSIHKNIAIPILFLFSLIGLTLAPTSTSALTYSQDIGVNFTFESSIQVTLSSANLVISNLTPGTASDSNVIDVNILTNNIAGYTLNANVGNNTTYNTRNLVHSDSTTTAAFTSVDFTNTPTITSNTNLTDNTWAYSYSTDNGTTWANYNGLPLYSDETNIAVLKTTNGPVSTASGDKVKFKIAAKAASSQASGEYNNVINFTAVVAPIPKTLEMAFADAGKTKLNGYYKMQDMSAAICADAEAVDEDSQMQAIDVRDNKIYWITKLRDNKCWMTQNLDLDLNSSVTLVHDNTDLGWGSDTTSDVAVNGFTPSSNTVADFYDWRDKYNTPVSINTGDYYANNEWYASATCDYTDECTGTDPVKFQQSVPFTSNGTHGQVGNHYNWAAAIATNDSSSITTSTYTNPVNNPQNSICPAHWRLPTISSQSASTANSTNEFARLAKLYGDTTSNDQAFMAAPLYFTRTGNLSSSLGGFFNAGNNGMYWSSSVTSDTNSYALVMFSTSIGATTNTERSYGLTIRCVAR